MKMTASKKLGFGARFGFLKVQHRDLEHHRSCMWVCVCDCGNTTSVRSDHLKSGATESCGCYRDKLLKDGKRTVHGECKRAGKSVEWKVWHGMLQRCYDEKYKAYFRYGGRGIRVNRRWMTFSRFLSDMGRRPTSKHTIERKDNDGNYCKSNCRWATRKDQANNRRTSRWIKCFGKKRTLSQWAAQSSVPYGTIQRRLNLGWSAKDAITKPVMKKAA